VIQQVNLYQPIFRAEKKVFSAVTILQACGLLVIGLAVIFGIARWQIAKLETQRASLTARQDKEMARIDEFNRLYPPKQKSQQLEQRVTQLTVEREAKTRAIAILAGGVSGNTQGFSAYLEGFARQRLDGLWLTGIVIEAGGTQLALHGSTLNPELVPRYLQQLGAESVLAGKEFKTFHMARAEAGIARIDFSMQSRDTAETP
jgi:Tfp pilus assembly protein PilN